MIRSKTRPVIGRLRTGCVSDDRSLPFRRSIRGEDKCNWIFLRVEAAICLMAFERQAIPPTINLDEVDPECTLNHIALQAIDAPVQWAMSGSFGFGGSNTCLVLRKAA